MPLPEDMDKEEKRRKLELYRETMTKVKKALESPDLDEDQDLDDFLNMLDERQTFKLFLDVLREQS